MEKIDSARLRHLKKVCEQDGAAFDELNVKSGATSEEVY
jgi:hypothetical protein